jgi:hypothetical protein
VFSGQRAIIADKSARQILASIKIEAILLVAQPSPTLIVTGEVTVVPTLADDSEAQVAGSSGHSAGRTWFLITAQKQCGSVHLDRLFPQFARPV